MIKKYWHIIIPITILIGFFGYKLSLNAGIDEMTTEQLAILMNEQHEDVFFVDVRESHEFKEGYIDGMMNIPLSTLDDQTELIPKDQTIVIICRSGNRSLQAANALKDLGYQDLVSVKGGMLKWEGEVTK
ncbi:rhodanese-like domain-containing protein [Alkalihalobacillus sp. MEB130]|uniref:rhodanese-like domain-containing protein n=1 Tax=Alkalihalobacillus sp. MEB130 TaxID=2976704 RepID=UPI0028E04C17|nr:rhodanese-like domain-containing protein [Alkalihalobacillus sp. MEB130]MDT8862212.1 rhodanese-like domain-containing protein [Alkalihalobacillus sp. MEB130]